MSILDGEQATGGYGKRAGRGGIIAVSAQIAKTVLQLGGTILLSRLLTPSDFGVVALSGTITGFIGLFTDLGLTTSTIQRKEIDQDSTSAIWAVNVLVGFALMILAWFIAPLAASLYGDARVARLTMASALAIPMTAAAAQHNALLARNMRWLTLQWTAIAAQFCGICVAVLLAWRTDVSYWALVVQTCVTAAVGLGLAWYVCPWRPTLTFNWTGAWPGISFGLKLTGFNLANYFHRQFDNVLIGWRWGTVELGFYARAYSMIALPNSLVSGALASAVVPTLSRLQSEPQRWKEAYLTALTALTVIGALLAATLFAASEPLVLLALGDGWERSVQIFRLLTVSLFFAIPSSTCGWILTTLGRSGSLFVWGLMASPAFVVAFVLGLPYGAEGVAAAYAAAMGTVAPCYFVFAIRNTPLRLGDIIAATVPLTVLGIVAALGGAVVYTSLRAESLLLAAAMAVSSVFVFYAVGGAILLRTSEGLRRRAARILHAVPDPVGGRLTSLFATMTSGYARGV